MSQPHPLLIPLTEYKWTKRLPLTFLSTFLPHIDREVFLAAGPGVGVPIYTLKEVGGSCPIHLIWWQQAFVCVSSPKTDHTDTNFPISVVEKGIWTAILHVGRLVEKNSSVQISIQPLADHEDYHKQRLLIYVLQYNVTVQCIYFVFFFSFFRCSWHVIQDSLCFEWVSWLKSDIGDFDSLSTFFRNKEFWSFSSPHQILVAFMIADTYQRETLHQSVCNSSMFQSIHWANQWNNRLWRGKSVK